MSDKSKKPSESELLKELRKKIEEKEKEFFKAQEKVHEKAQKQKKTRKSGQEGEEEDQDEPKPEDIQREIRRLQDLRNLLEQDELQFQSSWINTLEEIMKERLKAKPFEWRSGAPLALASAIVGFLGAYVYSLLK